jgi:hypothetical protein
LGVQYWKGIFPLGYCGGVSWSSDRRGRSGRTCFVMFVFGAGLRICCWPVWQYVVGSGNAVVLVTVAGMFSSVKIWLTSPVLHVSNLAEVKTPVPSPS